jgi:hypothetical protein
MKRTVIQTIGLVLSALLALLDIAGIFTVGTEQAPPLPLTLVAAAVGVITLVAVVPAWRGARGGLVAVVITRVIAALLNVPAYFTDGVTSAILMAATAFMLVGLLAAAFLLPALLRPPATAA